MDAPGVRTGRRRHDAAARATAGRRLAIVTMVRSSLAPPTSAVNLTCPGISTFVILPTGAPEWNGLMDDNAGTWLGRHRSRPPQGANGDVATTDDR